jgi:hypothetical protein
MDNKDTTTTTGNSIIKHIFRFDDETKSHLTDLTQYIMLAIIPIAILQNISERVFPKYDETKGTLELLAEILGQSVTTLLGLFLIHRIITAIPTFSGNAMGDINLFNIIIVFLLTSFMFDGKMQKKINLITSRTVETWEGTPDKKDTKKSKEQPRVSVSQPISRGGMPTHQVSRADYVGTHQNLAPPQQEMASQVSNSIADKQIYAGEQNAPPAFQEPMAGGSFLSGGFAGAGAPF